MMNRDLREYYHQRAAEYEKIYHKPERQEDLAAATVVLQQLFAGKTVFEMACGTGFWTERIAVTADVVTATDINQAVIDIARQKYYPNGNVTLGVENLFEMKPAAPFDALFGGFIWSHIRLEELDKFISIARKMVVPGGPIVFMDNRFVAGSNHPITRTDAAGNTFQTRKLEDGSTHEVLKNFPSANFLRQCLGNVQLWESTYFWIATG